MASPLSFLALAIIAITTGSSVASISPPIPILAPAPGLILGSGSRASAVVVEAFLETNCGDSARAWPELKKVADHYTDGRVAVIVSQMPLPYHRNSMICTQGIRSIQKLDPKQVKNYISAIYNNNLFLSNGLTAGLNDEQVLDLVADIAVTATGVGKEEFKADIGSHRGYVVFAWKYATRRGIAGTPWYAVNGVDLGENPSTLITSNDWIEYIDGVLG